MEYALRTFELTKKYGEKLAVNNVNMNIPKVRFMALLERMVRAR